MSRPNVLAGMVLLFWGATAAAAEIGFLEDYSLARDRTIPLKQLIPGTEDYYYFHSLHYLQLGQWDKVDETVKLWVDRYNYTDRVYEILNRRWLLTYEQDPEKSLDWVRRRIGVQFNHQRELLNQKPNLPTQLPPAAIAEETLRRRALANYSNSLQGFENAALESLAAVPISPDQRRELISRLARPDYPDLPKLISEDLNYKNSGGFGQFEIHRRLLLSQLDELLALQPVLLNQSNFVNAYLSKLQPSDDVNWRQDSAALEAHLGRLWSFAQRLAPVHNSLKAHILYHRLALDRARGKYDENRFLEYVKLPRNVGYIEPKYMAREEIRRYTANLQSDYSSVTLLPAIGDDEPLVRSYLQHFLLAADDYKAYIEFIRDDYLKQVFAETKIVNGAGDPEKWYSLLTPAYYQSLKERIDLDFAFTNRTEFDADGAVSLDLYVKNVPTLLVKVFEINTQNFYRDNRSEITTDINLDGLVANNEQTHQYDDPPLRRVRRTFEFPALKKRGVYVIDFIGNGISSRALIRKGKLHYLVRTSTAGQIFTILDEQNRRINDATIWLAGNLYKPEADGTILTPFSSQPARQPIVITHGEFSSLEHFQQEAETYSLTAAIYVDREELLTRRKARFLIRPSLLLNGTPVSLKILEEVKLSIVSTDLDGIQSTRDVPDFKVFEDRDSYFEFQTPQRLAALQCAMSAKVRNLHQNEKIDLTASQSFSLNQIDRTEKIEDLHFLKADGSYAIDVLGKSGESQPDRPVQLVFKHRNYRDPIYASLQTSANGRVFLGPLEGIATVTATGPEGTSHTWTIKEDQHTYSQAIHAANGQTILVPYMGTEKEPQRSELSLLELRVENFVADRFAAIRIVDGYLQISQLSPGDYSLSFKRDNRQIRILVAGGPERDGYVLGPYRRLEQLNPQPLQMERPTADDDAVRIQLHHVTPFTRVHVFARRFQPAYDEYAVLSRIGGIEPYLMRAPKIDSLYVAGRNIGDEFRYILERRFKPKYPGNLLERPSLLLNPWSVRKTETGEQLAAEGESFERQGGAGGGEGGRGTWGAVGAQPSLEDFANLDFLMEASLVLVNVVPDKDGKIELKRADLGAHQDLAIVAVDPQNTVSRRVSISEPKATYLDLRLADILDVNRHFTQQKRISPLAAGKQLVLPDITSAKFEVYDSLARVFGLYATLNSDSNLREFRFILNWPKLNADEKQSHYSKYASHELHVFLAEKDPKFFQEVIRPYLANKKDMTFVDHYLLGHGLDEFAKPWNFSRLNSVERILLGRRLADERAPIARYLREQWELLPPDRERYQHLFRTALKGSALETDGLMVLTEGALYLRNSDEKTTANDKGAAMPALATAAPGPVPPNAPAERAESKAAPAAEYMKKAKEQDRALRDTQEKSDQYRQQAQGKDMADGAFKGYFEDARSSGRRVAQYYRKLDKTEEWAENNYYHLLIGQQNSDLVTVNRFWRDFAAHTPDQPFYSENFAEAHRNFAEMMLALSMLDLPFQAGEHKMEFEDRKFTLTAGSPAIVFHEEILPAKSVAEHSPILVSQNFYRQSDRYRYENNQQLDKFVADEFLVDVVYGCQIVVTNPTSSPRKLDVLLQIPRGALPVLNAQQTKSVQIDLQPYNTQSVEYHFYFPTAGDFPHYPVHIAENEEVLAFAAPFGFHVVNEPSNIDKQAWDFVSQHGTNDEVLDYLRKHNLLRLNLDKIAFRMNDAVFFTAATRLLAARHVYNHTLWSYGLKHNDLVTAREYLQHSDGFVAQCGMVLVSALLTIDPVARKTYEHLDYRPLVNSRVNQLGRNRQILNDRFYEQYQRFMKVLSYRRTLDDDELLAVTYYMLLQDRIDEALGFFDRVNPEKLTTRLQYDYFAAHASFYREQPQQALDIAQKYKDHPVDRWQKAFASVTGQAEEIVNQEVRLVDTENREQIQTNLAAATPTFDFTVESKSVKVNYQQLEEIRVNYYLMDVELLFSRNPFVQGESRQFSYILPNASQTVKLPEEKRSFEFALPEQLHSANVLVEITAGGATKSQAYYANSLTVQTIENYGQVHVLESGKGRPMSKVYVKVYARMQDGSTRFYKDGYTDLRGRFDYTSLNTNELDIVQRFALLVLSDSHGAVVREAAPPKQ